MLKAVIIDDEKKARESLELTLKLYCKEVEIVGEADGVNSGFLLISNLLPDIVFHDIKMQDGTGFDLLKKFKQIEFSPVFITAYNDFAVKAFKFSALDYIVKPVDPEELISAVKKAADIREKTDLIKKIELLKDILEKKDKNPQKIVLKTEKHIHIVNISDIIYVESDGNYSTVFIKGLKAIVVSKLIKEFEQMLSGSNFLRIHQSYLINLEYLKNYNKQTGRVIMSNNTKLPVSVRKKSNLIDFLSNLQ